MDYKKSLDELLNNLKQLDPIKRIDFLVKMGFAVELIDSIESKEVKLSDDIVNKYIFQEPVFLEGILCKSSVIENTRSQRVLQRAHHYKANTRSLARLQMLTFLKKNKSEIKVYKKKNLSDVSKRRKLEDSRSTLEEGKTFTVARPMNCSPISSKRRKRKLKKDSK